MRFLVTAGPTREPIDPVRYLSNRSSGKMGYAIAAAAAGQGFDVVLVSGPVSIAAPPEVDLVKVETAAEMYAAVGERAGDCDVAVMAAAVADYTPAEVAGEKIKKSGETMALELVGTRDILGAMRGGFAFKGLLVGFAAETENLRDNALGKLQRKGCDLLVANDVSRRDIGFDGDDNEVVIFAAGGEERKVGKRTKTQVAEAILEEVLAALGTAQQP